MNHVYRIVWSAASNTFIAVAETASGKGKRSLGKVERAARALAALALVSASAGSLAGPVGGKVVAGAGSIHQAGQQTTISQATQKLALNWQSFNVGAGENITFNQPGRDSIALNRVLGPGGSEILGSIQANGQVFIVNPNGALFGKGSSVSAAGLVASTKAISDADFMAGNFRFSGESNAQVVNQGSINADGGYAALIGSSVSNQGLVSAKLGSVALAAGDDVTLQIDNGSLTQIQVSKGALQALAENQQMIQADGGRVILTAKGLDALSSAVVNNEGVIQARSLTNQGGVVRLAAEGSSSLISNSGSIASAELAASAGNILQAGSIKTEGSAAALAKGRLLQTASGSVEAGTARLDGAQSALISGSVKAQQDATIAGGSINLAAANLSAGASLRVGGSAHGAASDIDNAQSVKINASSKLSVGDHGSLVVWSDGDTDFKGSSFAGANSFTEISAKGVLKLGGSVKAGVNSEILFDPTNIVIDSSAPGSGAGASFIDLANSDPNPDERHGDSVLTLGNGNVVVLAPGDSFGGADAGAVFLYSGADGSLISALVGESGSLVGSGGLTKLSNENFVISSPSWSNNGAAGAGAVTWGRETTGVSGIVSENNSLVGATAGDSIGELVTPLANGNYVVSSQNWNNPNGAVRAGAAAWGNGSSGTFGVVSEANALVGSQTDDSVASTVTALSTGHYVVGSPFWSNGGVEKVGAATWGDGFQGASGAVSSANSLTGQTTNDLVSSGGVTALANGNYVLSSPNWDQGAIAEAGAATWGNGYSGAVGLVSTGNSLVGSTLNDRVSANGVTALTNGHYVVLSSFWNNAGASRAGAATWRDGEGVHDGSVSAANSIVGDVAESFVGEKAFALNNGNYVVASPKWSSGSLSNRGAATWANGFGGLSAVVSDSNSLVGSRSEDQVGSNGVTALTNGHYVVASPFWSNNGVDYAGAVTWGDGQMGVTGEISAANSLVGTQFNDAVGGSNGIGLNGGVTALTNGNYVVSSNSWRNGSNAQAGAVTWGDGSSGAVGAVSAANSIVGEEQSDIVGYTVVALNNGNYVIGSPDWTGSVGLYGAGAVTWGNGLGGSTGVITAGNSVLGSSEGDYLGANIIALSDGNYAFSSHYYTLNGNSVGAVSWGDGATGSKGTLNPGNALFGASGDRVGEQLFAGPNGSFVSSQIDANGGAGSAWLIKNASSWSGGPSLSDQLASSGDVAINPSTIAAAAGAGSTVTLQASNNITVKSALNVDGRLVFEAGNEITLNAPVSSASLGDALVLSSSHFINNAGANALSTPNGRWLVYSSSPATTVFGGLVSGSFAQWGAAYQGATPAPLTGNRYVFSVAPLVSVTATGVSRAYDGSATFGPLAYTSSGLINAALYGGVFSQDALSGSMSVTSPSKNVGSYAISQGTLAAPEGYSITFTGANAVITPKALTMSGILASNKTYDGTTAAELAVSNPSVSGVVNDEDVQLSAGGVSGAFSDKNAGASKTVTISGLSLSGADANNYSLGAQSSTQADIFKADLELGGLSAANKTYDGTIAATLYGFATVTAIGSDVVSVTGSGSASFANKNAGFAKAVTVSGYSLAGSDAVNYNLIQPIGLAANIAKANLTVSGVAANNKTYDASIVATLSGSAVVSAFGSDEVSLTGSGIGSFADKNAGSSKAVSVSGYSLSGADSGNYNLIQPSGLTASIAKANLALTGLAASDKTYDGSALATLSGSASVTAFGLDEVSIGGQGAGSFLDKNAGQNKAVSVSGYSLSGADSANYTLVAPAGLTASIAKKALTVSGVAAQSKTYDGTALATIDASDASLSGKVNGDDLTVDLSSASGAFADKNAGKGKSVSLTGLALSGADAANYEASLQTSAVADIDKRALAVSASASGKTYDGTALAQAALSDDRVSGDQLILSGSAAFADKNAGVGKTVTVGSIALSGADAANYELANASALATADIAKRALAVSVSAQNKTYDGTASAIASFSDDRVSGDELTLSGSAAFLDKNAGANKTVTVSGVALAGGDASNYTLNLSSAPIAADIAKKTLAVSGVTAKNKTYDGTALAQIDAASASLSGKVSGDDLSVSLSNAAGAFADKNAGKGKAVSVTGLSLSGADAGNYEASGQTNAVADIDARALKTSAVASNKTYDGSISAKASLSDDRLAGDQLSVSGSAAFIDKLAGERKTVIVSDLALSGSDAGNYKLIDNVAMAFANIDKRSLNVSASAANKTYDGTTAATALFSDDRVSGDLLDIQGLASFADKNAGAGKTVSITGVAVFGADAGNYTLTPGAVIAKADIAKKVLTVSGVAAADKVYDGTAAAQVNPANAAFTGQIAGDELSIDASGASGSFSDKNAGSGKTVLIQGLSLSGADAGNYSATASAAASASIFKRSVSIAGLSALSKTYDGSTLAQIDVSKAFIDGLVSGDSASALSAAGSFADKNAGVGKAVVVTGAELSGVDAGNYAILGLQTGLFADIGKKTVSVEGLRALDKRFDGLSDARLDASSAQLSGLVAGDQARIDTGLSGRFSDPAEGAAKPVSFFGLALSGADALNYELSAPNLSASILPALPETTPSTPATETPLPYPEIIGISEAASTPLAAQQNETVTQAEEELRRRSGAPRQSAEEARRGQLGLIIEQNGVRAPELSLQARGNKAP